MVPSPDRAGSATHEVRILVAEDNLVNQKLIVALLTKSGYTVTLAQDGREALQALTTTPYDLVFMDVEMPGLDGVEATRRYRAQESGLPTPIIAMTAHNTAQDEARCRQAGMDDFLSKPVRYSDLRAVIERYTRDRHRP